MTDRRPRAARITAKRCAPDDLAVELAVLAYLAADRPEGTTITMLALHFNDEFNQGIGGSAVERAVRELVRDGQLRMQGARVITVQAAEQRAPTPTCFGA